MQELIDYYRAGFPVFWITTKEPDRVKTSLKQAIEEFQFNDGSHAKVEEWSVISQNANPLDPLLSLANKDYRQMTFLYNYHWFISGQKKQAKIIQTIQELFPVWASQGQAIAIVSPVEDIPVELETDVTLIRMPLPNDDEIMEAINHAIPDKKDFQVPTDDELELIKNNSKGMTRRELHNVYNLSLVKTGTFDVQVINDYRSKAIEKSGIATVLNDKVKPEEIIGYDIAKEQVLATINNPASKGILFIGPPGCGKTRLIKSFAYASQKLGVMVDTGMLFSKYQGETDKNVRALIDLAWALKDCYFIFDEIEKQFSGVGSSGDLDSGVTTRALSKFLTFFQERPPGCYVGATANSFIGLPPEYIRAGRWDTAPIYIGLPSKVIRSQIMKHYINKFELSKAQTKKIPDTNNWAGNEIEALCHNAHMRGLTLEQASEFIVPIYETKKEEIQALEKWAEGRTIPAEKMPSLQLVGSKAKRKIDLG